MHPERLRERAGQLVLFGAYQGEIPALIREGLLTGGAVVWSMWGLLGEPSGQRLQAALGAGEEQEIRARESLGAMAAWGSLTGQERSAHPSGHFWSFQGSAVGGRCQ